MTKRQTLAPPPMVPVSWGELLDKITILEIKDARISDPAARANVQRELALLRDVAASVPSSPALAVLLDQLRRVNMALWDIEDDIRRKETASEFDDAFVALARSVYLTNDERSSIKRRVNALLGSALFEEKQHPA